VRAVIYTRASLDRTGEGKSNARQEDECKRLIEYKRWEHVGTEADVSISAYTEKERPAWLRVLAMIEAGEVDVVVAFHLDRLTRNMADLERLILLCEKHNVSVATATGDIDLTNDTGRMVARILAAVARQEVERKAARQRLAHVQRRSEGRPWTAVKMLGYSRTGEVIPEEAEAIKAAAADVLNKGTSLAEIGRQWAAQGLESPYKEAGKPWSPRGVHKILTNPRLAGFITHHGEILGKGAWEPILDETTATLLQGKLNAPARVNGKAAQGRKPSNLLTGIATCGVCGGGVRAAIKRDKSVYVCGKWHVTCPREDADNLVKSVALSAFRVSPDETVPGHTPPPSEESIAADIDSLRERQAILARSFAGGIISESAYEAAADDISSRIEELRAKAANPEDGGYGAAVVAAMHGFLQGDLTRQRSILERLTRITINPAGTGNRLNASEQVQVQVRRRTEDGDTWEQVL
jgi:site-specific DNA recombinase